MQIQADYDVAIKRKYPEQVAIAIVKDPQGKPNPITVGWLTRTSIDPPMLAVSIGKARYSREAIEEAKSFVVCLPSKEMVSEAIFFGTKSGRDIDKLAEYGTKHEPASKIDGVILTEALANFECELAGALETGDHVLFAGRVVATHMNQDLAVRGLYALGNDEMGGVVPG